MEYTMEQLRAAYALNLCTVSVSQIIDYADVNIMEQEYEAILNNLNLEQMPKDEALLDILRQIMDTIILFRISKEDRNIIEQEYRRIIDTLPFKRHGNLIAGLPCMVTVANQMLRIAQTTIPHSVQITSPAIHRGVGHM